MILDVGCGSGVLCHKLAEIGATAVGVDSSESMIAIAIREYGNTRRVKFRHESIEKFARTYRGTMFDVCVSNMAFVTMPKLREAMLAIASVMRQKGTLVFTITHPCFWNRYRKYEPMKDFDYMREHSQKGTFKISLDRTAHEQTTHFHRPLSEYFRALHQASFVVQELDEPMPKQQDLKLYPHAWAFPRFISIKAIYLPGRQLHQR